HTHISDFYSQAGEGAELYVMVVANDVTMSDLCDNTEDYATKLLQAAQGRIKLLGVTRVPDEVGTLSDQFEADLIAAIEKAQELRDSEFAAPRHRPVQILLEGRNWQGTASTSKDFRTMEANRVSVVISQDKDVADLDEEYAGYAHVGLVLGRLAAITVNRNIGRVKDGPISIGTPALSDGTPISEMSDADLTSLNDKGMIFLRKHVGVNGVFFNDDPTCAALSDDYCYINHGRVMD